jgi:predicted ATPase
LTPNPPPVICIEEPELGLHPDVLPVLAELFKDASERCQLIITTHSDILVDAMTDAPESIMVCERHSEGTSIKRLSETELRPWLEKYRLGELWSSGEIGGNRW